MTSPTNASVREKSLHTPELAHAINTHPRLSYLPPKTLDLVFHFAGHDLAHELRVRLHQQLSTIECRDFLDTHDPLDPTAGQAWISMHLPNADGLLDQAAATVIERIAQDPWTYLINHP